MFITKTSPISGLVHTLELDITDEQLIEYAQGIKKIQEVFPELSPAEREFIMTGITLEEWNSMSPDND